MTREDDESRIQSAEMRFLSVVEGYSWKRGRYRLRSDDAREALNISAIHGKYKIINTDVDNSFAEWMPKTAFACANLESDGSNGRWHRSMSLRLGREEEEYMLAKFFQH